MIGRTGWAQAKAVARVTIGKATIAVAVAFGKEMAEVGDMTAVVVGMRMAAVAVSAGVVVRVEEAGVVVRVVHPRARVGHQRARPPGANHHLLAHLGPTAPSLQYLEHLRRA